nr:uncharacterized protein LOC112580110 [Bubalus bubalis]
MWVAEQLQETLQENRSEKTVPSGTPASGRRGWFTGSRQGRPGGRGAESVAGKPRGHGSPVPRRPGTGGCSRGEHGDGRPGRLRQRLPLGTGALGSSGHPSGAARSARALRAGREQGAGPLRRAPPLRTRDWLWAPRPPTGPVGLLHHCFGPWTSPFLLMDPKCSCPTAALAPAPARPADAPPARREECRASSGNFGAELSPRGDPELSRREQDTDRTSWHPPHRELILNHLESPQT